MVSNSECFTEGFEGAIAESRTLTTEQLTARVDQCLRVQNWTKADTEAKHAYYIGARDGLKFALTMRTLPGTKAVQA
jgi:hypothetical protein